MAESVSLIVAVVILFLVFRWVLGSNNNIPGENNGRGGINGVRRRTITPDMVESVKNMFPEVSTAAIQADLALTGSVELTCEKILANGGLPMPEQLLPRTGRTAGDNTTANEINSNTNNNDNSLRNRGQTGVNTGEGLSRSTNTSNSSADSVNLAEKYLSNVEESTIAEPVKEWSNDSEKRQELFLKRKQFMVLEARRKFLENQKKN
ncbi:hypothetical protein K502DRAFT_342721 [Neoconidiobolus thromboides FSU 785]|nr:hypothetical protein K502DRAFT_342721 [Neoconidiobolus thromboides FSU 785]